MTGQAHFPPKTLFYILMKYNMLLFPFICFVKYDFVPNRFCDIHSCAI